MEGSNDYVKINKLITLSLGLTSETSRNFEPIETAITDTQIIRINNIVNSKFETCIDITRITHDITLKDFEDSFKLYELDGYVLTDENNNTIKFSSSYVSEQKIFDAETNKELSSGEQASIDENTKIRIEKRLILKLDKSIQPKEIKISSAHYNMPNERTTDERDRFFEYDWYDLEEGLSGITFESPAGGTITIDNIEITDDTIDFYFTQKGAWLNGPTFSIRKNNGKFSHYSASKIEQSGINGFQNKATFYRVEGYGINVSDYTDDLVSLNRLLIDMDNLQFSVYDFAYNCKLYDISQVDFPDEITETASVKNIKIEDTKTTILRLKMYSLANKNLDKETTKFEELETPEFYPASHTILYEIDYTENNKVLNRLDDIFENNWYWFESLKDLNIYKNNATGLVEAIRAKYEKAPEKPIIWELKPNEFVKYEQFEE